MNHVGEASLRAIQKGTTKNNETTLQELQSLFKSWEDYDVLQASRDTCSQSSTNQSNFYEAQLTSTYSLKDFVAKKRGSKLIRSSQENTCKKIMVSDSSVSAVETISVSFAKSGDSFQNSNPTIVSQNDAFITNISYTANETEPVESNMLFNLSKPELLEKEINLITNADVALSKTTVEVSIPTENNKIRIENSQWQLHSQEELQTSTPIISRTSKSRIPFKLSGSEGRGQTPEPRLSGTTKICEITELHRKVTPQSLAHRSWHEYDILRGKRNQTDDPNSRHDSNSPSNIPCPSKCPIFYISEKPCLKGRARKRKHSGDSNDDAGMSLISTSFDEHLSSNEKRLGLKEHDTTEIDNNLSGGSSESLFCKVQSCYVVPDHTPPTVPDRSLPVLLGDTSSQPDQTPAGKTLPVLSDQTPPVSADQTFPKQPHRTPLVQPDQTLPVVREMQPAEQISAGRVGLDPVYWAYPHITIHNLLKAEFYGQERKLLSLNNRPLNAVRIVGIVTSLQWKEGRVHFDVEDTTGKLACTYWHNGPTSSPIFQNVEVGSVVRVTGFVGMFRDSLEVKVMDVTSCPDLVNAITVHLNMASYVYKKVYSVTYDFDIMQRKEEFLDKLIGSVKSNVVKGGPCTDCKLLLDDCKIKCYVECLRLLTGETAEQILSPILRILNVSVNHDQNESIEKFILNCRPRVSRSDLQEKFKDFEDVVDKMIERGLIYEGDYDYLMIV